MTCSEVQALLSDALDVGPAADGAAAAAHLDGCADCARVAHELSSIHRLALEIRAAEILAPARSETKKRKGSRRRLRPSAAPRSSWAVPASMAAVLVLGLVAFFALREPERDKPSRKDSPTAKTIGTAELRTGSTVSKRELAEGDALKTGAETRATFVWNDGTRLEVAEDTQLDRFEERGDGKVVAFGRGAVTADVAPQKGGPLRFVTPHGEARVLGTLLRLKVDGDAATGTRLEVERGKVELSNRAGMTVLVETGHFAVAATGRDLVSREIPTPGWKNVTGDVGGAVWGKGGVTLLGAVPGRDEVIAGVTNAWLWSTTDGGASWKRLGDAGEGPIENHPHSIIFDPVNPRTFWVTGIYGPGIFKTTNGGAGFRRLGRLDHVDGIAVDFSDPARKTLLATKHLDGGGLQLSRDGGETWEQIGDRLPKESNSSCGPFILDSKTFLVDGLGSLDRTEGIYRSADGGLSWTRVSKVQTAGSPMLASDGALYWQPNAGVASGLLKSIDRGLTWSTLKGPVKSLPVELPGGKLVGCFESQLYESTNGGAGWVKLGGPAPIKPAKTIRGMAYEWAVFSPERRAFTVSRGSEGRIADAIFRWDLPE